jgi:hypothetical protein
VERKNKTVGEVEVAMERYFRTSKEFYDAAISYLGARNKHSEDLSNLSILLFWIRWNFGNKIDLLFSEFEVLAVSPYECFDEYTYLRCCLSQLRSSDASTK